MFNPVNKVSTINIVQWHRKLYSFRSGLNIFISPMKCFPVGTHAAIFAASTLTQL